MANSHVPTNKYPKQSGIHLSGVVDLYVYIYMNMVNDDNVTSHLLHVCRIQGEKFLLTPHKHPTPRRVIPHV